MDISPGKSKKTSIDMMLMVYASVINGNYAVYCSAPITTGRRYFDWLKKIEQSFLDIDNTDIRYRESHFQEVIEPNRAHAQNIINEIRKKSLIVIDPTALDNIDGWTQEDWYYFWGKVIERYADNVLFIDGWQYSNGCVTEFWVACTKQIPVLDENQCFLSLEKGIEMIKEAISILRPHFSVDKLENTLYKLIQLSNELSTV